MDDRARGAAIDARREPLVAERHDVDHVRLGVEPRDLVTRAVGLVYRR